MEKLVLLALLGIGALAVIAYHAVGAVIAKAFDTSIDLW